MSEANPKGRVQDVPCNPTLSLPLAKKLSSPPLRIRRGNHILLSMLTFETMTVLTSRPFLTVLLVMRLEFFLTAKLPSVGLFGRMTA